MTEEAIVPDSKLADEIRSGDGAAFQTLYYRYYQALFSFVFQRVRSQEQTKDFLQEVFTRLWEKRSRIDSAKSIRAYLYRIANNLIIDQVRKGSSERAYRTKMLRSSLSQSDEAIETKTAVEFALNNLPDKMRQVFALSRYEGLTYAEIAQVCDVSVKTVESRMSQALQRLRTELSDE